MQHAGDGLREDESDVVVGRIGELVGDRHGAVVGVHCPPIWRPYALNRLRTSAAISASARVMV